MMARFIVFAWVGMLVLALVPSAAAGTGTGLESSVCVNLAVLLALTITPIETLTDAFRGIISTDTNTNDG